MLDKSSGLVNLHDVPPDFVGFHAALTGVGCFFGFSLTAKGKSAHLFLEEKQTKTWNKTNKQTNKQKTSLELHPFCQLSASKMAPKNKPLQKKKNGFLDRFFLWLLGYSPSPGDGRVALKDESSPGL